MVTTIKHFTIIALKVAAILNLGLNSVWAKRDTTLLLGDGESNSFQKLREIVQNKHHIEEINCDARFAPISLSECKTMLARFHSAFMAMEESKVQFYLRDRGIKRIVFSHAWQVVDNNNTVYINSEILMKEKDRIRPKLLRDFLNWPVDTEFDSIEQAFLLLKGQLGGVEVDRDRRLSFYHFAKSITALKLIAGAKRESSLKQQYPVVNKIILANNYGAPLVGGVTSVDLVENGDYFWRHFKKQRWEVFGQVEELKKLTRRVLGRFKGDVGCGALMSIYNCREALKTVIFSERFENNPLLRIVDFLGRNKVKNFILVDRDAGNLRPYPSSTLTLNYLKILKDSSVRPVSTSVYTSELY